MVVMICSLMIDWLIGLLTYCAVRRSLCCLHIEYNANTTCVFTFMTRVHKGSAITNRSFDLC